MWGWSPESTPSGTSQLDFFPWLILSSKKYSRVKTLVGRPETNSMRICASNSYKLTQSGNQNRFSSKGISCVIAKKTLKLLK